MFDGTLFADRGGPYRVAPLLAVICRQETGIYLTCFEIPQLMIERTIVDEVNRRSC
jgi:hypothetical protein